MPNFNPKIPRRQFPSCVITFVGAVSIAAEQRRQGLPPTPGSVERIVHLARFIICFIALAHAFRDARLAVLDLTGWDREFLREARVGA
jgi:hypothetical protein